MSVSTLVATVARFPIRAVALEAAQRAQELLTAVDPPRTTITIDADIRRVIPEVAVGGRTGPTGTVRLHVDLVRQRLARCWLPALIAHEMHHSVRIRTGPGYGASLAGALISEGLADRFALECYPALPLPWTHAVWTDELDEWTRRAREESTTVDVRDVHGRWFFGAGDVPRWAGYAIGYSLVDHYLDLHPDTSAGKLVTTSAERILHELDWPTPR